MASQFQNRLIGIIIVVAIGVIFLPDLFGGKTDDQGTFASIPLKPVSLNDAASDTKNSDHSVTLSKDNAQNSGEKGDNTFGALSSTPTQITVDTSAETKPKPADNAVPVTPAVTPKTDTASLKASSPFDVLKGGWMIQLGTFRNADNAKQLVTKLEEAGYPAHTVPDSPKSGDLTKVVVGPNLSKDVLLADLKPLNKLTGLTGKIVPFDALNP